MHVRASLTSALLYDVQIRDFEQLSFFPSHTRTHTHKNSSSRETKGFYSAQEIPSRNAEERIISISQRRNFNLRHQRSVSVIQLRLSFSFWRIFLEAVH